MLSLFSLLNLMVQTQKYAYANTFTLRSAQMCKETTYAVDCIYFPKFALFVPLRFEFLWFGPHFGVPMHRPCGYQDNHIFRNHKAINLHSCLGNTLKACGDGVQSKGLVDDAVQILHFHHGLVLNRSLHKHKHTCLHCSDVYICLMRPQTNKNTFRFLFSNAVSSHFNHTLFGKVESISSWSFFMTSGFVARLKAKKVRVLLVVS